MLHTISHITLGVKIKKIRQKGAKFFLFQLFHISTFHTTGSTCFPPKKVVENVENLIFSNTFRNLYVENFMVRYFLLFFFTIYGIIMKTGGFTFYDYHYK